MCESMQVVSCSSHKSSTTRRKKSDGLGHTHLDLPWEPAEIPPCDPAAPSASPLLALAVGARGNAQAELIYDAMMELARYRGD